MTENKRWYRDVANQAWYRTFAPFLQLLATTLAIAAMGLAVFITVSDHRQNEQRAADNAARDAATKQLLDCFDTYAARQSTSNKIVRKATVERDLALARRDDALTEWTGQLAAALASGKEASPAAVSAFVKATIALNARGEALSVKNEALARARDENPIVKAPSTFCGDEETPGRPPAKLTS